MKNRPWVYSGAIILFTVIILSGCQAEEIAPTPISLEGLSIEKQGYVALGMIELVPDDLSAPVLPEEPTQAELGSVPYYQICMACHGNWAQGLTDEWRETGFGEDHTCWQSKCHGSAHPPQGFSFPKASIPPLTGRGTLAGITNAEELHRIIGETMPWWSPESLTEDERMNLTAYLMWARGELPERIVLTEDNLAAFPLHFPAQEIVNEFPGGILLISGLLISMLAYMWIKRVPKKRDDS